MLKNTRILNLILAKKKREALYPESPAQSASKIRLLQKKWSFKCLQLTRPSLSTQEKWQSCILGTTVGGVILLVVINQSIETIFTLQNADFHGRNLLDVSLIMSASSEVLRRSLLFSSASCYIPKGCYTSIVYTSEKAGSMMSKTSTKFQRPRQHPGETSSSMFTLVLCVERTALKYLYSKY